MENKINLIIFDLDGVLIDSKKNMHLSWKKVQNLFNIKIKFKSYFKNIGLPFNQIIKKLGIKNKIDKVFYEYKKESIKNFSKIRLYSGVTSTLKKLKKNYKIAIVTSKDSYRTSIILNRFNINFFDQIVCFSKKFKGKPSPDQIVKVLKSLNQKKNRSVYVGDMLVDYKAACAAGVEFVHAKYGYGKKYNFYKNYINKFSDIKKLLIKKFS